MLVLRCALLAALIAAAAAAWQENVRPKVFAQLGESTDSQNVLMPLNSRCNNRPNNTRCGFSGAQAHKVHL